MPTSAPTRPPSESPTTATPSAQPTQQPTDASARAAASPKGGGAVAPWVFGIGAFVVSVCVCLGVRYARHLRQRRQVGERWARCRADGPRRTCVRVRVYVAQALPFAAFRAPPHAEESIALSRVQESDTAEHPTGDSDERAALHKLASVTGDDSAGEGAQA
jgi:hypothetical protein